MGVHRRVLLDVCIRSRHIGFRLVVVVVGHEVLNGVARKELPKLPVKLRRERLVGGQYKRRALDVLDDLGHGESLAGTGHPKQGLMRQPGFQAVHQAGDGGGLIARRSVIRYDLEIGYALHGASLRHRATKRPTEYRLNRFVTGD